MFLNVKWDFVSTNYEMLRPCLQTSSVGVHCASSAFWKTNNTQEVLRLAGKQMKKWWDTRFLICGDTWVNWQAIKLERNFTEWLWPLQRRTQENERTICQLPLILYLDVVNYLVFNPSLFTSDDLKTYTCLQANKLFHLWLGAGKQHKSWKHPG